MMKMAKQLPFLRIVALLQLALLTHRHLSVLTADERWRLIQLARRPHKLTKSERRELRRLAARLEPGLYAKKAMRTVAPLPGGKKQPKG